MHIYINYILGIIALIKNFQILIQNYLVEIFSND